MRADRERPDDQARPHPVTCSDPVWALARRVLRIERTAWAFALGLAFGVVNYAVVPLITGHLVPRPGIVSSLDDWPAGVYLLLIVPTITAFYLVRQDRDIAALAGGLRGALKDPDARFERIAEREASRWPWVALPFVAMLVALAIHVPEVLSRPLPSHYVPGPWRFWLVSVPGSALVNYMVFSIATKHLIVISSLYRTSRTHGIRLRLFHHDATGGTAFVGRYALSFILFLALIAVNVAVLMATSHVVADRVPLSDIVPIAALLLWLPGSLLLSILPMHAVHGAMRDEKQRLLRSIEMRATQAQAWLEDPSRPSSPHEIAEELGSLRAIRDVVQSLPNWPANLDLRLRFIWTIVVISASSIASTDVFWAFILPLPLP
jgi:hypothetical protein